MVFKEITSQRFYQVVTWHISSRFISHFNSPIFDFISDLKISDVDMFCLSGTRIFTILIKLDGTGIILLNEIVFTEDLQLRIFW